MENVKKSAEEILADLQNVSPLAMPGKLAEYEFYDRSDAFKALEKAVNEFRGQGGVAKQLFDTTWMTVVDSVGMCLARRFLPEKSYRELVKCGGAKFASSAAKAFTFGLEDYGPEERDLYSVEALKQDRLRRNMVRQAGSNGDEKLFNAEKYDRKGDFEALVKGADGKPKGRSVQFVEEQSKDGKTVRGVGGKTLSVDNKAEPDKTKRAQGDHVTPLKMIHEESGYFIERYVDMDKVDEKGHTVLQQIVNDDSNFQVLSADKNSSKGGALTNVAFIEQCAKVEQASAIYKQMENATPEQKKQLQAQINELGLSPTKRKAARNMAHEEDLSPEEKKDLEKYKLSKKEKEELKKNQEKSETAIRNALLKEGTKTVLKEQIGRIIEILVGPIGFELRDSILNGITHGFDGYDTFDAFCKRMWRALKYVARRLLDLLGDVLGDLSKMVATLFMNACKVLKDFFGKFFDLALSGISVLVESVKILCSSRSMAEKGEAILKVVVGFATGILGQTVIDSLLSSIGLPPPFSEIAAAILSALLSTLVMAVFDKLDIFGNKTQMLRKRIDEIFDARQAALAEAAANFDMVALQLLKNQRVAVETIRHKLSSGLDSKNYEEIDAALNDACELFQVEIPYKTPAEFVGYVRRHDKIIIK